MTSALPSDRVDPQIRVRVDVRNPGQFFACCGLLELADRFWPGTRAEFSASGHFTIRPASSLTGRDRDLAELVSVARTAQLSAVDPEDELASALQLGAPFGVRLDWWHDSRSGGHRLKVWAGSMSAFRIARAMQAALPAVADEGLLDHGSVVLDPDDSDKKREPFYFDARRGANALALDIGFMPDTLGMRNTAFPAVEFLCLVGLQRFRPAPTGERRVFEYHAWGTPLDVIIASAVVGGASLPSDGSAFRFENAFRTDQRKHKAFAPATPFARR